MPQSNELVDFLTDHGKSNHSKRPRSTSFNVFITSNLAPAPCEFIRLVQQLDRLHRLLTVNTHTNYGTVQYALQQGRTMCETERVLTDPDFDLQRKLHERQALVTIHGHERSTLRLCLCHCTVCSLRAGDFVAR